MLQKKDVFNPDGLTALEKFFVREIVEIKALASLNKGTLEKTFEKQKNIIANQKAEIEMLKEQNTLLKQQILRLCQIQEAIYNQITYVDNKPGVANALYGKHKAELNKFAETHSQKQEESFKE